MINVAHSSISEWDIAPDKVDDCERQILDYKQALLVIAADRVCDLDLNGIDESPVEANGESPIHGTVLGRPRVYRGDADARANPPARVTRKKTETLRAGQTLIILQEEFMKKTSVVLGMMLLPAGISLNTPMLRAEHDDRSGKEKALIIGGSAAAGAALGGLLGGKRGAVAGAIAGGSGGAVYDRATTDDRNRRGERSGADTAILIGGSSGAGAVAGGILGGTQGALIGAGIGAAGGYILHKTTEDDWDRDYEGRYRDGYRDRYRYRNAYRDGYDYRDGYRNRRDVNYRLTNRSRGGCRR
jgi:hypothetical protein